MPIYEYRCAACEEEFEFLHRGRERAICPACGSKKLSKRLSVFASLPKTNSMPKCKGTTPTCAPEKCRSGACGLGRLD
ncbi:MAG: zinc ribbon domain-containing protein [Planctomycetota bacterium]